MANPLVNTIAQYASQAGLDPRAVLGVAFNESGIRRGAVGDNNTSFGPFQMHEGGALGSHSSQWAMSNQGIQAAIRMMAASGARGLTGRAAIAAIVHGFERPANPGAEIATALGWYTGHPGAGSGATPAPGAGGRQQPYSQPGGGGGGRRAAAISLLQSFASGSMGGQPLTGPFAQLEAAVAARQGGASGAPGAGAHPIQMEPGAGTKAGSILSFARNQIGVPYQWGGESRKGYDCSGLVQAAFAHAGINLPRTSQQQFRVGQAVKLGRLQPGDLVFSNFEGGRDASHVVIYIGNGKVIAAPSTGERVQVQPLSWFTGSHYVGARRVLG